MILKHKKNLGGFVWTRHALSKMKFYGLSENRLKKIFKKPDRREKGIAPTTVALMQRVGKNRQTEIWLMYKDEDGGKKKIITAWRFPGISREGEPIPILDDIKEIIKI